MNIVDIYNVAHRKIQMPMHISLRPPEDPVRGSMFYDTATQKFYVFDGVTWLELAMQTTGPNAYKTFGINNTVYESRY